MRPAGARSSRPSQDAGGLFQVSQLDVAVNCQLPAEPQQYSGLTQARLAFVPFVQEGDGSGLVHAGMVGEFVQVGLRGTLRCGASGPMREVS